MSPEVRPTRLRPTRRLWLVLTGVGLVLVLGLGLLGWRLTRGEESCVATGAGERVQLTREQAENAATMAAVAVRRGLPARAVTLALVASWRHGDLQGDRLFGRQGEGSGAARARAQVGEFYDALSHVPAYAGAPIAKAARAAQDRLVDQRGEDRDYAEFVERARVVSSALTGQTREGLFSCAYGSPGSTDQNRLDPAGLVPRAAAVRADMGAAFGKLSLGGFAKGGVKSGHMPGSAHYEGRAIDVFVRPIKPANQQRGWAIATYLVAHAERLDIQHVIFDGRIWSAGPRARQGWRDYTPPSKGRTPAIQAILEHRDHVHVDVGR